MKMVPIFGYWNFRGLGQPIRLLLAYTETKFEERRYFLGTAPEIDQSEWLKEKFTLGLDFPNLPYFIDEDVKLTQSLAIMHYLARKHKLDAETETERIRADFIEQEIRDFRENFATLCSSEDFEKLKDDYVKTLPAQFEQYSKFLGKRQYFAGDKLTHVDFHMFEALDAQRIFSPGCLDDFQNLKEFCDRFEKLPTIEKYLKSEDYLKWPLTSAFVIYGARSM